MHHWNAANHCLRSATPNAAVREVADNVSHNVVHANTLHCYVDASWAEDVDTRHSQTGYVFCYGNAAISWHSHLQHLVTLSSTEAEYVALGEAVKEALYLRNLFRELLNADIPPIALLEDNQSTMKQALSLQSTRRTKHIDIRHHFLKQHFANGAFTLHYIPTHLQAADCLTKSVNRVKVEFFRQIILGG